MGPVANQGCALLMQGGDDQLADLSVRYILPGLGIHHLKVQIIRPYMHAAGVVAADADAGTVYLGQTVNVIQLYPQFVGDPVPHLFTPAFGADDALAQVDPVPDAPLCDFLCQQQRIGGGGAQHGGFHIHHHP